MKRLINLSFLSLCLAGNSMAGTISVVPITDLASTGISSSNTYTHAISGGSAATVNGVNFDLLDSGNTPANFSWNTNGFNQNQIAGINNGDWDPALGGVTATTEDAGFAQMMGGFTFSGNGDATPASQTFTFSGLTAGTTYDARFYIRVWDTEGSGRPLSADFTNGTEMDSAVAPEDRPSQVLGGGNDHQAYYLNYRYLAQGTEMVLDAPVLGPAGSGSFHMYGMSNQVIPEPSSASLLLLGLSGFFLRRRR